MIVAGLSFSIKPNAAAAAAAKPAAAAPMYVKVALPPAGAAAAKPAAPSPVLNVRPSASPQAAAAAKPAQQKFPPSFQAWVERCFSKCKTNADRQASVGSEVWGGLEKGQNRQGVRKG